MLKHQTKMFGVRANTNLYSFHTRIKKVQKKNGPKKKCQKIFFLGYSKDISISGHLGWSKCLDKFKVQKPHHTGYINISYWDLGPKYRAKNGQKKKKKNFSKILKKFFSWENRS